ncbi:MAG: branched-chain amino acid ABC transporter permease [Aquiluna sp.]
MDFGLIFVNAIWEFFSPTTAAFALAAIGLSIHFGYTGLLNFGQAGYMLVGAYGFALPSLAGWPLWSAFVISIGMSLVLSVILGLPTLRLRADYLAIVTISSAEILRFVVSSTSLTDFTGGQQGLNGYNRAFAAINPIPEGSYGIGLLSFNAYDTWVRLVAWSLVALAALLVFLLMRSPWGRTLKGIREDEDAATSLGKPVFVYKMQALVVGGLFGSLAGVMFILPRSLQPGNYATTLTFFVWAILLLGGAATIWGPIVGSIVFWVALSLTQGLLFGAIEAGYADFMSITQAGQIRFILVGLVVMFLVIFRPQGFFGNKKELSFGV